jgi:hypothetical protein
VRGEPGTRVVGVKPQSPCGRARFPLEPVS